MQSIMTSWLRFKAVQGRSGAHIWPFRTCSCKSRYLDSLEVLRKVEFEADGFCLPQTGMRGAFGKPQGTCARVAIGQILLSIRCKDVHSPQSQEALRRAKFKFAGRQKIVVSRNWCVPCADHQPVACFLHISCKLRQYVQGILAADRPIGCHR